MLLAALRMRSFEDMLLLAATFLLMLLRARPLSLDDIFRRCRCRFRFR